MKSMIANVLAISLLASASLLGCAADTADGEDENPVSDEEAVVVNGAPGPGTLLCINGAVRTEVVDGKAVPRVRDGSCAATSGGTDVGKRDLVGVRDSKQAGINATLTLTPVRGGSNLAFIRPTAKVNFRGLKKKPGKAYYATLLLFVSGPEGFNGFAESSSVEWNGTDQEISLRLKKGDLDVKEAEGGVSDALFPVPEAKVKAVVGVYEYDAGTRGNRHRSLVRVERNVEIDPVE